MHLYRPTVAIKGKNIATSSVRFPKISFLCTTYNIKNREEGLQIAYF